MARGSDKQRRRGERDVRAGSGARLWVGRLKTLSFRCAPSRATGIAQPRATLIPMSKLILAPFGALPMSILVPVLRGPGPVFMVAARTDSQDVSVTFTLLLFF